MSPFDGITGDEDRLSEIPVKKRRTKIGKSQSKNGPRMCVVLESSHAARRAFSETSGFAQP